MFYIVGGIYVKILIEEHLKIVGGNVSLSQPHLSECQFVVTKPVNPDLSLLSISAGRDILQIYNLF